MAHQSQYPTSPPFLKLTLKLVIFLLILTPPTLVTSGQLASQYGQPQPTGYQTNGGQLGQLPQTAYSIQGPGQTQNAYGGQSGGGQFPQTGGGYGPQPTGGSFPQPGGASGGTFSGSSYPSPGGTNGGGYPAPGGTNGGSYPAPGGTNGGSYPSPGGTNGGGYPAPGGTNGGSYPAPGGTNGGSYPSPGGTNGGSYPSPGGTNGGSYPSPGGTNGGSYPSPGGTNGGSYPSPGGANGGSYPTPGGTNGGSYPSPGGTNGGSYPSPGGTNGGSYPAPAPGGYPGQVPSGYPSPDTGTGSWPAPTNNGGYPPVQNGGFNGGGAVDPYAGQPITGGTGTNTGGSYGGQTGGFNTGGQTGGFNTGGYQQPQPGVHGAQTGVFPNPAVGGTGGYPGVQPPLTNGGTYGGQGTGGTYGGTNGGGGNYGTNGGGGGGPDLSDPCFRRYPNCIIVNAQPYERRSSVDVQQCKDFCTDSAQVGGVFQCRSFVYDNENQVCDLFGHTGNQYPSRIISYPNRDYYEPTGQCSGNGDGYGNGNGDGSTPSPGGDTTTAGPGVDTTTTTFAPVCDATCPSGQVAKLLRIEGFQLQGSDDLPIPGLSEDECIQACFDNCDPDGNPSPCQSFDFTGAECIITEDAAVPTGNGQLTQSAQSDYYEKICVADAAAGNCPDVFDRFPQMILVGFAETVVDATSFEECLDNCLNADALYGFKCASGMFYFQEEQLNCILNTEDRTTQPDLFVQEDNDIVDYFETGCAARLGASRFAQSRRRLASRFGGRSRAGRREAVLDSGQSAISSSIISSNQSQTVSFEGGAKANLDQWTKWSPCDKPQNGRRVRYKRCRERNVRNCEQEVEWCNNRPTSSFSPEITEHQPLSTAEQFSTAATQNVNQNNGTTPLILTYANGTEVKLDPVSGKQTVIREGLQDFDAKFVDDTRASIESEATGLAFSQPDSIQDPTSTVVRDSPQPEAEKAQNWSANQDKSQVSCPIGQCCPVFGGCRIGLRKSEITGEVRWCTNPCARVR